jgi:hypothetical protein
MVSRATLVGSRVTRGGVACALLLATSLGAGCAAEDTPAEPRRPDRASFEATIYPVLLRDCGFVACHGDGGRAFRVVGPGRTRLDPLDALDAPPTAAELDATFERTVSMLATAETPGDTLLLRKPLDAAAGGAAHRGVDRFGRNVYASREDASWQALEAWVAAAWEVAP